MSFLSEYGIPINEYLKRIREFYLLKDNRFELSNLVDELYCKLVESCLYLKSEVEEIENIFNYDVTEEKRLRLIRVIDANKLMQKQTLKVLDDCFQMQIDERLTRNAYIDSHLKVNKTEVRFEKDNLENCVIGLN